MKIFSYCNTPHPKTILPFLYAVLQVPRNISKKESRAKDTFVCIILNMTIEQISQNCILAQGKKREGSRRPLSVHLNVKIS
jgi:hypothetical protein